VIRIEDAHLTFNPGTPIENRVLRGIGLTIETGEFVTVIGSNGAGKSTLLNVIAGEYALSRGRVLVDDRDLTGMISADRAGLVARVFQDPRIGTCETLTIEENLALAASRGIRRGLRPALNGSRRAAFREVLARLGLGLEARLSDQMGLLSGGQRQAVSLLMATLNPMRILLLDEHVAALDPGTAAFVLDLTRRLIDASGLTALMVTHSMRDALALGTRTVMLHEGQVVLDVSGPERAGMRVEDLVDRFRRRFGELDNDALLLAR
jgi:putative ABC transport system ATP-binding protein